MPVKHRPRIVSTALKSLAGAVAAAVLMVPGAHAAGLGKLTVLSALGQPLRAEIELTAVTPEEAGGLSAKLAPAEAFRLANIDFNPTLNSLRFDVEQRGGRQFIRVSSSQPVNEPFVDLLLELNWTGGRMVREYTFLLDPAEMRATQSAQVAPVDVLNRQGTPAAAQQSPGAAAAPAAKPARPAKPAAAEAPAASQYQVKRGDNLSRIASQLKPVDVSLDMMLVALYRANPDAFMGKNMNRLKSGQILAVPDADAIRASAGGEGEAHGVVVAHATDFAAYRSRLAGQVATSAPAREPEAVQSKGGKITAKVEERPTAANESKDQLKLSKAGADKAAGGKTGTAEEDKIAKEKQMSEASDRVKELEKNVSDLEKLMAVKSKAGSEPPKAAKPASAVVQIDNTPPQPKPAPVVVPKQEMQPTWVDTVKENIKPVAIGLAAVLAGLLALVASRRRKQKMVLPPDEPSILGVPAAEPPAQGGEPAADGLDGAGSAHSVFNSNFAPSASQLDANEVDPVAEADVYIAYGRDAQAEEILKEALRVHPERHAVRLKLLEIYAARKDARAFEAQASEMYALTKGHGEEWAQALALGLALDPANPLYSLGVADAPAPSVQEAGAAEPVAAPETAAQAFDPSMFAPPPEDSLAGQAYGEPAAAAGLDFDSGDLDRTAVPQQPTPASVAASDPEQFLDFDLDGLSFDAPAPAPASPAADADPTALPTPTPAPADDFGIDFGIDLPPPPAPEQPKPAADPLAELDLMDFDLAPDPVSAPVPAPQSVPEPAPAPSDLPDFADFDLSTPEPAPAPAAAPVETPEFDLSGIDLDLGAPPETAAGAPREEVLSAHHMEMDTKLDLAVAYQEIGDKEGARELLDEVLRGGSDEQVAKANAMKAQLG